LPKPALPGAESWIKETENRRQKKTGNKNRKKWEFKVVNLRGLSNVERDTACGSGWDAAFANRTQLLLLERDSE